MQASAGSPCSPFEHKGDYGVEPAFEQGNEREYAYVEAIADRPRMLVGVDPEGYPKCADKAGDVREKQAKDAEGDESEATKISQVLQN